MGVADPISLLNDTIKGVWGESVLYDYGGAFLPLTAVFDDEADIVTGDLEVVSSGPQLFVKLADFPSGIKPKNTHKVKIFADPPERPEDAWYQVSEVLPDGKGGATLLLKITKD